MRPRSKNHPPDTNSPVYYTNSTFIVSTIIDLQSIILFCHTRPINALLPSIIFYARIVFSSLFVSFIFIAHFFVGLQEPARTLKFSLFVHSHVCQITHSFLNRFQPNLCQHFSHVCSTCHTIFSLK